jgi:hypothetical protein
MTAFDRMYWGQIMTIFLAGGFLLFWEINFGTLFGFFLGYTLVNFIELLVEKYKPKAQKVRKENKNG